jgi:hypothetical protein
MNYERIYSQIVDRAKNRVLESYTEKHHILPRCMNGSDDRDNLVNLTAREHFICHQLLVRIYPENPKLKFALWAMCNMKSKRQDRYTPSSRIYERAKNEVVKLISEKKKGTKVSDEQKRKTSETLKGRKRPTEVISKIVNTRRESGGWKHSEETKKKIKDNNGMNREEVRNKLKGRTISEETRKKRSESSVNKRPCNIDGVRYESIAEASKALNIKWDKVSDRIKSKSKKFKNWNYE